MADLASKLRADAQANRERILEVARAALAADPAVSLNAIAKAAGVGAGTLYRHFPNREALVVGVYWKEIDALALLAPQLLAEYPPLRALRLWCDQLAIHGRTKHGIADVLHMTMSDQNIQEVYGPFLDAVRQLLDACERAGAIRPGLDALDFLMVVSFLWRIPTDAAGEAQGQRLLALIFRGLSAEGTPS